MTPSIHEWLRTQSALWWTSFSVRWFLTPWNTWEPSKVTCHLLPASSFPTSLISWHWTSTLESQFLLSPQMGSIPSLYSHTPMPHTQHQMQMTWFLEMECKFYDLNRFINRHILLNANHVLETVLGVENTEGNEKWSLPLMV